ncbi:MAG: hypothetical protein ACI38Q_02720 [Candidatus Bruticola sp.]
MFVVSGLFQMKTVKIFCFAVIAWAGLAAAPSFPQQPELRSNLKVNDKMTSLSAPEFVSQNSGQLYKTLDALAAMQATDNKLAADKAAQLLPYLHKIKKAQSSSNTFTEAVDKILSTEQIRYIAYLGSTQQLDYIAVYEDNPKKTSTYLVSKVKAILKAKAKQN